MIPMLAALIDTADRAVSDAAARITDVRYAPGSNDDITFHFDGKPYRGKLAGRNRSLLIVGDGRDAHVALRALLDGDAQPA